MQDIGSMDHASIAKVAEAMISVLGSSAVAEARQKAAEALDQGDLGAFHAWQSIMRAARSALVARNSEQP
jgi:hypothetical protein